MITLFGHGYVGSHVAERLTLDGIDFSWRHHTDSMPTEGLIVDAAGFVGTPNVDECERRRADTVRGTVGWAQRVLMAGLPVVYVGSGCLYSGENEGHAWTEDDLPNFRGSWYSICKQAEECVYQGHWVLRIRMPFGIVIHPRNLLTKLRDYPTLLDGRNSISRIEDVARVVSWFVRERPLCGVYNVCNPGPVWTHDIAEVMGVRGKPWFDRGWQVGEAVRSECVLDTTKLTSILTWKMDDALSAVRACA